MIQRERYRGKRLGEDEFERWRPLRDEQGMNKTNHKPTDAINLKRIFLTVLVVYALLIVSFYFLAGDQLRYRESRGNLELLPADAGAAELAKGVVVEQVFHAKIQRLESVAVQWGTYYRPNFGTVTMELVRQADGEQLMSGSFDTAQIAEGQILSIESETPIETAYDTPLLLRLWADSPFGSAVRH